MQTRGQRHGAGQTEAGWQSSANTQGLRDQLGGLRPAAGRAATPSKNPYQHVQSKLSGYLQGEEAAPQPQRGLQRRDRTGQSNRSGNTKRSPRSATSSPPPSPTLTSIPQLQLRERITIAVLSVQRLLYRGTHCVNAGARYWLHGKRISGEMGLVHLHTHVLCRGTGRASCRGVCHCCT